MANFTTYKEESTAMKYETDGRGGNLDSGGAMAHGLPFKPVSKHPTTWTTTAFKVIGPIPLGTFAPINNYDSASLTAPERAITARILVMLLTTAWRNNGCTNNGNENRRQATSSLTSNGWPTFIITSDLLSGNLLFRNHTSGLYILRAMFTFNPLANDSVALLLLKYRKWWPS